MLLLLLNLTELMDFSDLYIKLYVSEDAQSDSDLQKGPDLPIPFYLHISAILKQIITSAWRRNTKTGWYILIMNIF